MKRDFANVAQPQFMGKGPGHLRMTRYAPAGANIKTYGSLAERAPSSRCVCSQPASRLRISKEKTLTASASSSAIIAGRSYY